LYTLEVTGPILPGCVYELFQLLKASQKGNFKANLSAHQPTVAFNVPHSNIKSENIPTANGSCLQQSLSHGQLKYYKEAEEMNAGCFLKDLKCTAGLFTWTS